MMKAKYSHAIVYGAVVRNRPNKTIFLVVCGTDHSFNNMMGVMDKNSNPIDNVRMGRMLPSVNSVCRMNCEKRPSNTPLKRGVPSNIQPQSWLPQIK